MFLCYLHKVILVFGFTGALLGEDMRVNLQWGGRGRVYYHIDIRDGFESG